MARGRKTIPIDRVKELANEYLAREGGTVEGRQAYAGLAMSILHDTGNYRGFQYLAWVNGGCKRWHEDSEPEGNTPYFGDTSRIILA